MKGIILAGGSGTRLYPVTRVISKQILPVYDKPMIYYPLSVLMLMGIREVLIISTPRDLPFYRALFNDGSDLGMEFSYVVQDNPNGIAEAFLLGANFIGQSDVTLILGDNIFFGGNLGSLLTSNLDSFRGALIYAQEVNDPERYGVVEFDSELRVISICEKPTKPKSDWAVTGLYSYDNSVVERARDLKPSLRGELEITDINQSYLDTSELKLKLFSRGVSWFDAGTHESYLEVCNFVRSIETRQNFKIACLEEIAFRNDWIKEETLERAARMMAKNSYGAYLAALLKKPTLNK